MQFNRGSQLFQNMHGVLGILIPESNLRLLNLEQTINIASKLLYRDFCSVQNPNTDLKSFSVEIFNQYTLNLLWTFLQSLKTLLPYVISNHNSQTFLSLTILFIFDSIFTGVTRKPSMDAERRCYRTVRLRCQTSRDPQPEIHEGASLLPALD